MFQHDGGNVSQISVRRVEQNETIPIMQNKPKRGGGGSSHDRTVLETAVRSALAKILTEVAPPPVTQSAVEKKTYPHKWSLVSFVGGIGISILLFLTPKSGPVVAALLLVMYACFAYPILDLAPYLFQKRRIAALVTCELILLFAVAGFGWWVWPKPEVVVIFKSSPLLTAFRKWRIVQAADEYRGYLNGIGYDVPPLVPPIGAVPGGMAVGSFGEGYNQAMILSEDWMKFDLGDAVRFGYGNTFFFNAIKDNVTDQESGSRHGEAVRIYADYYRCSFAGKRIIFAQTSPDLDKWEAALWELRSTYGKEFMDAALFYAVKRWAPFGAIKDQGSDFDSFFSWRLLAGVAVLDNNTYPFNNIRDYLRQKGLLK